MKDRTIITVFIVFSILTITIITLRYNNLKKAYIKAETDKVGYCKTINELCKDTAANNLLRRDYYSLWEENQRFSSVFAEIENEPGGHEILKKLWSKYE